MLGDPRGNFLMQGMVCLWDELPKATVDAGTKATFKGHMGRYMDRKVLESGLNIGKWD